MWDFLDFVFVDIRLLHRENMVQGEGKLIQFLRIRPIKRNSHGLLLYSRMLLSDCVFSLMLRHES